MCSCENWCFIFLCLDIKVTGASQSSLAVDHLKRRKISKVRLAQSNHAEDDRGVHADIENGGQISRPTSSKSDADSCYLDEVAAHDSSAGPPAIIRYQRERTRRRTEEVKEKQCENEDDEDGGIQLSYSEMYGPLCEFCGKPILPLPTLEQMEDTSLADQVRLLIK